MERKSLSSRTPTSSPTSWTANPVKITMTGYIQSMISDNDIRRTSQFPASTDLLKLSGPGEPLLPPDLQKSLHSTVARIQYLASRTRLDIQFVTSHLASKVNKFVASDQGKVTKLLEYLASTADEGITLHIPDTSNITMSLYADASFAIHELSRSHSGGCLSLGSGSIAWKSKKQTLTTTSTAESELVALSEMSALLFHMEKFLTSQGCSIAEKVMYQDNMTTIHMLTTEKPSTMRNAHIGSISSFGTTSPAVTSRSSTSDLNS
jgi:hypothetical protein